MTFIFQNFLGEFKCLLFVVYDFDTAYVIQKILILSISESSSYAKTQKSDFSTDLYELKSVNTLTFKTYQTKNSFFTN